MNEGFFQSKKVSTKKASHTTKLGCNYCQLHRHCESPKMEPSGEGKKQILIIAEYPKKYDDVKNMHLAGEAGDLLNDSLDELGVNLEKDCWLTYAVQCWTQTNGKDREPRPIEVEHCRQRLWADIDRLKPKVILLLSKPKTKKNRGGIALESFLGGRWKKDMGGINKWRGWTIPDREAKAWVCPTFHPSFVLRSEKSPVVRLVFEQDLARAIQRSEQPLPVYKDEATEVQVLGTPNLVKRYFSPWFRGKPSERPKLMSFDYETSGLKPHRQGHYIRCVAVTTDRGTVAFTMSEELKDFFRGLLENHRIGKSAHNVSFEDSWSNECLDAVIEGWEWDSQMAAHILDNRGGISSLKFQAYVNFGVIDYDSEIEHYLKGDDKDSNSFNRIGDAPIDKLLTYCGMDSLFGYRLTLLQQTQIRERGLQFAYDLFHEGLLSLAEMEQTGFRLDSERCKKQFDKLTDKMKTMTEQLMESDIGKMFVKEYGKIANINSPVQLANILFNKLKVKSVKKTTTGRASVDEEALGKMNLPFVKRLVEIRKIKKNLNTYLKGFMREEVDGLIHPFYHLNIAKSFRSSSSRPNAHNIPIRDEDANKLIRSNIIPRDGNQILDMDFKGAEVSTAASVTQDPNLIEYVSNDAKDMHRDMAMQIYMLKEKEVSKDTRFSAKGSYVFAQFYGDWYEPCAKNLWGNITEFGLKVKGTDTPMREHLADNGIKSLTAFIKHLRDVEDDFWGRRFRVYDQWKTEQWKAYQKTGYIDLVTGFRCTEIMDKNQVLNRPIQGPAFHLLLHTLNRLVAIKRDKDWASKFIMQIHDSVISDTKPSELNEIIKAANQIVGKELPEKFSWLSVPMVIEYEVTGINESWYMKRELKIN